MKQYISLVTVLFLLCSQLEAQVSDLPVLKTTATYVKNKLDRTERVNLFWEDGSKKVDYVLEDSVMLRNEYYRNGHMKSSSELILELGQDTVSRYDDSIGRDVGVVARRPVDVLDGKYIEYSFEDAGVIKVQGQHKRFKKVGEWYVVDERTRDKTVINFNEHGELEGPYAEYYYNWKDGSYILKREGAFKVFEYDTVVQSRSGKESIRSIRESRRAGIWRYYTRDGVVLEQTEYKWGE